MFLVCYTVLGVLPLPPSLCTKCLLSTIKMLTLKCAFVCLKTKLMVPSCKLCCEQSGGTAQRSRREWTLCPYRDLMHAEAGDVEQSAVDTGKQIFMVLYLSCFYQHPEQSIFFFFFFSFLNFLYLSLYSVIYLNLSIRFFECHYNRKECIVKMSSKY